MLTYVTKTESERKSVVKKAQTLQGKLNFRYAIVIAVVIFSIAILVSIVSARLIREKTIENCRQ